MKIPACVWHMIKLVPKEAGPRYQLDGIRFTSVGDEQRAVFTDGRILVVAGWPEKEPADMFVPRAVLCLLSGYFHDECDCGQGEVFSPVDATAVVIDNRVTLGIVKADWSISFKNEAKLRFPNYESVMAMRKDSAPADADFDPLFLGRLFTLFSEMNCRRITWTGKGKDSPIFFVGKNDQVSLRGCVMSLTEKKSKEVS